MNKKIPSEKLRFHRGFSRFWGKLFEDSFRDAKRQKGPVKIYAQNCLQAPAE